MTPEDERAAKSDFAEGLVSAKWGCVPYEDGSGHRYALEMDGERLVLSQGSERIWIQFEDFQQVLAMLMRGYIAIPAEHHRQDGGDDGSRA
ncbi:MAG: hypothetical protein AAGB23_05115 [Pseudomonadota bacterium]